MQGGKRRQGGRANDEQHFAPRPEYSEYFRQGAFPAAAAMVEYVDADGCIEALVCEWQRVERARVDLHTVFQLRYPKVATHERQRRVSVPREFIDGYDPHSPVAER